MVNIDAEIRSIVDVIDRNGHADLSTYEQLAPVYDYLYGRSYDYELQAKYVQKLAPNTGPFRLLEIGCGTGRLLNRLADAFPDADLYGVDIHEDMIRIACERLEGTEVTLVHADVFDTDGAYDIVPAFNLLPHIDDETLPALFKHVSSLLTDGGALVFDYKDPRNNPNGQFDVWEDKTDEFGITARFTTVYDGGQPYYAVSHEFIPRAEPIRFSTGELMEVNFQTPGQLEATLQTAGFDSVEIDECVGDQSGVVVARV